jgi:hypothetical protein
VLLSGEAKEEVCLKIIEAVIVREKKEKVDFLIDKTVFRYYDVDSVHIASPLPRLYITHFWILFIYFMIFTVFHASQRNTKETLLLLF